MKSLRIRIVLNRQINAFLHDTGSFVLVFSTSVCIVLRVSS